MALFSLCLCLSGNSWQINWASDRCLICDYNIGVPNQRELQATEEIAALQQRYQQALQQTPKNLSQLTELEQLIQKNSKAVINTAAEFLDDFLSSKTMLMSNYNLQTASETRSVADMKNDKQRRATEALLFGEYTPKIRYAALSLDHKGLVSYGSCSMTVSEVTARYKATVLEENSFDFVRQHRILPGDELPKGYRATWENRHLLAVAKLAPKLTEKVKNWAELLLKSNGNRHQDEFMEVHIYGAFDKQAVTEIAVPKQPKTENERVAVEAICAYAAKLKIPCGEI